ALALSPDGRHAYQVVTELDTLIVFERNTVPGFGFGAMLERETEIHGINDVSDPGPAVAGMEGPVAVAVSDTGNRVYVLSPGAIAVFDRDTNPASPNHGRVSFAGALASSDVPADSSEMALTAEVLFVAGSAGVAAFQLDPISGLPSFLRLHAEEAGWMPRELALLPDRSQLFVASGGAPYLRRYGIGGNGVLTLADSLGTANYADATELAVAPEGHHLYLSSQATATLSVIELAIDSGAMLDQQSYDATLFAALVPPPGADPFASLHSFTIAPDGEHLLLTSNDEGVLLQLRRDPLSGLLGAEALVHRGIAGTQPAGAKDALVVTPDGRHLLVASASNGGEPLQLYARRAPDPLFALVEVDRNGDPAASGAVQGLLAPTDVAVSQDGDHVYVVSLADDSLAVFRR